MIRYKLDFMILVRYHMHRPKVLKIHMAKIKIKFNELKIKELELEMERLKILMEIDQIEEEEE